MFSMALSSVELVDVGDWWHSVLRNEPHSDIPPDLLVLLNQVKADLELQVYFELSLSRAVSRDIEARNVPKPQYHKV